MTPAPSARTGNQQRTLLRLLAALRPHWRTDRDLPTRIQRLLSGERAFGSRDRRLYRELIYTTLRYLPWIEPSHRAEPESAVALIAWLAAEMPATSAFRAATAAGWPGCPAGVAAKAAVIAARAAGASLPSLLPEWLQGHCPAAFQPEQLDALHTRGPLWLRLQATDPAAVETEFSEYGWSVEKSAVVPGAWRVLAEADVARTRAFADGKFEVQDLGSQLILPAVGVAPGERWLDACAGAGGKTLQLSALLGPGGRVEAHDVRPAPLSELRVRAGRAGIEVSVAGDERPEAPLAIVTQPAGTYDGVLVDAPCTGTGTWRRAPHLKWTTTPEAVAAAAGNQLKLLSRFSARVKPGGRLIYATCSLSRVENEDVVSAFLAAHDDFISRPLARTFGFSPVESGGISILPAAYDTDGFFVCAMSRRR